MGSSEENQKKARMILERGIGILAQEHASSLLDKDEADGQRAIQHQYVDDLIDQNGVSRCIGKDSR